MHWRLFCCCVLLCMPAAVLADGNRLTYLDGNDPYYVSRQFSRLVTPQWIGEEGVEAVVILAIDDMRETARYETFLRPILQRLQRIDGRAPVSIMTNRLDPKDPQLKKWLSEGLSLETHSFDHPCPLLAGGDFTKSVVTYERCVDLLSSVPGSKPVAFRTPCCDSLNTVSPRFFAEIFNRKTAAGNFLTIDSSVFNLTTPNDPDLPRAVVLDSEGRERFRKYFPTDGSFVNSIDDYPYPYVIGKLCWEFPCATPSDWQAQNLHQPNNPITIRDWKAQLDACVIKQGTFSMVFHPHNWVRSEQVVDFIDYAVTKHGRKVKFLTFREAYDRINKNLLAGQPLRAADGGDNGVRLLDLNNDGFMDVVIANETLRQTRVWSPKSTTWIQSDFPIALLSNNRAEVGARFGIVESAKEPVFIVNSESHKGGWRFDGKAWVKADELLAGLELDTRPVRTGAAGRDLGVRFRDVDGDGCCDLIVSNESQHAIFRWANKAKRWEKLSFHLPAGATIVNAEGRDNGLRFVDVDGDGFDDVLFANEKDFGLFLFGPKKAGWTRRVLNGTAGSPDALRPITVRGANQGAWFHSSSLVYQNENTSQLKSLVDRRPFQTLLKDVEPTAKSTRASLNSIQVRPGFKVELAASEPLVLDPIAMAWGPDGKLWVVEMGDYPLGVDGKGKPGGRVLYLEDTNGDGRYVRATVFLDGLPFPTGVLPWRKGILVTCAPDIFYAEDTNGDGKADVRQVLYTGFGAGNQQHRVNTLCWGLDNWIYCANGDSAGSIRSIKTGQEIALGGRDFRIRPDDGAIDLQAGQTQFGRSRNDWGDWFGNNNSNPMWHFALSDQYIRRNRHVAAPEFRVPVSETPGASGVYPISRTPARFNDPGMANHFTSACSAIVYRDDLFGPAFANNTFVSEPVHNLVHREIMTPIGSTFTSRRAVDEKQSEFLASTDNWFRPTSLATGPDGALWVADMYRAVIEHPEWIPRDWQARIDLRAGADMGRIYRVFPIDRSPRKIPRLDQLDLAGLVAALDSPSGWQRDLAQQMLLWKGDPACIPALEKLAHSSTRPLTRLHALCTLDGLGGLKEATLRSALADAHPGVRRHAVRLCEPLLKKLPGLGELISALATDTDPQVRIQVAYTLGEWQDPRAGLALGKMAVNARDDRFLTAAVLSSVNASSLEHVLTAVLGSEGTRASTDDLVQKLLHQAAALDNSKALVAVFARVATEKNDSTSAQFSALANLLDALERSNKSLASMRTASTPELQAVIDRADKLVEAARRVIADDKVAVADQLAAMSLLGRGLSTSPQDLELLAARLAPQYSGEIQDAAIGALARFRDARVPELLLRNWKSFAPARRSSVFDVLFRSENRLAGLLDAIEKKSVAVSELDAVARQKLIAHPNEKIRKRALGLLDSTVTPDRQRVIETYHQFVRTRGSDSSRGEAIFAKHCSSCHQLGNVGNAVGPALASVGDKSPEGLLTAILDPNRVVEARYTNYLAVTKRGQLFTGILASETGNSVTLIGPDSKPQVILRNDLESLTSTGKSPMPEALEKDISAPDMADLIAYIRASVPLPIRKSMTGNLPETILPTADGILRLTAAKAQIFGSTLVFEQKYGNLGYWNSQDDFAAWTIETPRAARYEVWLDWACPEESAGNTFTLMIGGTELRSKVASTGSWDVYKEAKIGEIKLSAGMQKLTMRSFSLPKSNAMLDLRAIKLVPVK